MWMSRMLSKNNALEKAEKGSVTISSASDFEAGASVNERNISSYAPYGYSYSPEVGAEVILIPSSDGQVALGTKSSAEGLESGEIRISSKGGATIELKNDGRVVINQSYVIDKRGVGGDEYDWDF